MEIGGLDLLFRLILLAAIAGVFLGFKELGRRG